MALIQNSVQYPKSLFYFTFLASVPMACGDADVRVAPLEARALSLTPGYYDSVDAGSAASLRTTLHPVIDDHQKISYTASGSTDTWDVLELADEHPEDPAQILTIYRNRAYTKVHGGTSGYNREHVWPKSYGFPDNNSGNYPYTDCHALFLADSGYNSSRSNKPFGICSAACTERTTEANAGHGGGSGAYPGTSNWTSSQPSVWETWPHRRGDVARALFYLDLRYEGGHHGLTGAAEPNLELTDDVNLIAASNTGTNESLAHMGRLSALLAWHAQDPVDDHERTRNEIVYGYQGNRNPFVDHPEWIDCLYAGECGAPPPPTPWINEIHYDNVGGDQNEAVEIAGPAGLSLTGYTLVLYNGNNGGVYKNVALEGTLPGEPGCSGTVAFSTPGLQNGAPDGLALVAPDGDVVEFISYEGVLTAVSGPATGMTTTDIGVAESGSTPVAFSLQLGGEGSTREDFAWQPAGASTFGSTNSNQILSCAAPGCGSCDDGDPCTDDRCEGGACVHPPRCDDASCGNGGICCNGECVAPSCGSNSDCSDAQSCSIDQCENAGTCRAACVNDWPSCGINDGCCAPECSATTDIDCAPPTGCAIANSCGGRSADGCWCDSACVSYGDCCPDSCLACGIGC